MLLATPRLLVFDLDGTLIDSHIDLVNSVNATLTHFGQPELPDHVIAGYIGDGAHELVRRALGHAHLIAVSETPQDQALVAEAVDFFLAYYRIHKLDTTYVYSGVLESLEQIRSLNPALPMAVLTNKPVLPSQEICAHFGLDRLFFAIYGGNSFATKKPHPEGLQTLIAEASQRAEQEILASETVMIGDSNVDVETARNAGASALGCLYGLSPETLRLAKPDVLVTHAAEWLEALNL